MESAAAQLASFRRRLLPRSQYILLCTRSRLLLALSILPFRRRLSDPA